MSRWLKEDVIDRVLQRGGWKPLECVRLNANGEREYFKIRLAW